MERAFKPYQKSNPKFNTPVQQQKEFEPTWLEWVAKHRVQIAKNGSSAGAEDIIYEVPEGVTFFLTSASLCAINTAVGATHYAWLSIDKAGPSKAIVSIITYGQGCVAVANPIYTMPIRLPPGSKVILMSDSANIVLEGNIVGFLELNPSA